MAGKTVLKLIVVGFLYQKVKTETYEEEHLEQVLIYIEELAGIMPKDQ